MRKRYKNSVPSQKNAEATVKFTTVCDRLSLYYF